MMHKIIQWIVGHDYFTTQSERYWPIDNMSADQAIDF